MHLTQKDIRNLVDVHLEGLDKNTEDLTTDKLVSMVETPLRQAAKSMYESMETEQDEQPDMAQAHRTVALTWFVCLTAVLEELMKTLDVSEELVGLTLEQYDDALAGVYKRIGKVMIRTEDVEQG